MNGKTFRRFVSVNRRMILQPIYEILGDIDLQELNQRDRDLHYLFLKRLMKPTTSNTRPGPPMIG